MKIAFTFLTAVLMIGSAMAQPARVVSVGGASTEIIYALGASDMLVGSDTTSYFPKEAEDLPKVGYQRALSVEGILSLSPDLLVLNNESGPAPVLEQLKATGVNMISVDAGRSIEDVMKNVTVLGQALKKGDAAVALNKSLQEQYDQLKSTIANVQNKKRVMFILSHGGGAPMVAGQGTSAEAIIALAGAENAVSGYHGYKPLTPEAAISLQPDYILVTERGLEGLGGSEKLKDTPGLSLTSAVQENRVIAMDSLRMLGFGPRTVEAALDLHKAFYTP